MQTPPGFRTGATDGRSPIAAPLHRTFVQVETVILPGLNSLPQRRIPLARFPRRKCCETDRRRRFQAVGGNLTKIGLGARCRKRFSAQR